MRRNNITRTFAAIFSMILAVAFIGPRVSYADSKTVRVGWYESPFNIIDENGRRSGYAYEYQRKIAAYTGWQYEYVEGTWTDLLGMLERGEIDMLSDVSYTKERAEKLLYPSVPMGQENYYIYKDSTNPDISSDNLSTPNGKRIGGDEFAAILMNDDFANKDSLVDVFVNQQEEISASVSDQWNQLHIAIGLTVYTPDTDGSIEDTIERADQLMYENKRIWKDKNARG